MDFVVYWLLAFTIIVLFLGGLTYFIQRQNLTDKSQIDTMNQQQHGRRNTAGNRRKNARNANKKKQQVTNTNLNNNNKEEEDEETQQQTLQHKTATEDEQSDGEYEQNGKSQDTSKSEQIISPPPPPTHVEDEQEPTVLSKQRNKNKNPNDSSSNLPTKREERIIPTKPQASVAPVKQTPLSSSIKNPTNNLKFQLNYTDDNPKMNGHSSSSSYNIYTFSAHNPLPPRFQQQRQQREATSAPHRHRRRRGGVAHKRSSIPPGSAARSNDFIPSSARQQPQQQQFNDHEIEFSASLSPQQQQQQQQQQQSMTPNGYSSESDIVTDTPSINGNNSLSPLLSTSVDSQLSLQRLDLVRSLSAPYSLLDELISVFDHTSFSSEELELILNKIATKHISDKHDVPRPLATAKTDKTFERIIDETYRSQAKILAIELQSEKNRVLELTKSNADMENTIRQFQQQQPSNIVQYQQMILPYQMQLRRLADENARLQHQLHAYSMLPATINELKQQHQVLNEQTRQMSIRNSALENEVAESERASKHAAEIYKKADAIKQERIEQMIADINKYKKLDKELTNLRQKYNELEKDLSSKIAEITTQRDQLQTNCDKLNEKLQQYEKLPMKKNIKTQQELNDLKTQNDQLRRDNWKHMEELNKSLQEQNTKSS